MEKTYFLYFPVKLQNNGGLFHKGKRTKNLKMENLISLFDGMATVNKNLLNETSVVVFTGSNSFLYYYFYNKVACISMQYIH